jgi:hypothetical protein
MVNYFSNRYGNPEYITMVLPILDFYQLYLSTELNLNFGCNTFVQKNTKKLGVWKRSNAMTLERSKSKKKNTHLLV